MFFPGTPFDPPRAGTIARTRLTGSSTNLSHPPFHDGRVLDIADLTKQLGDGDRVGQRLRRQLRRTAEITDVQVIGRVGGTYGLESSTPQIRRDRVLRQVIRVIDL